MDQSLRIHGQNNRHRGVGILFERGVPHLLTNLTSGSMLSHQLMLVTAHLRLFEALGRVFGSSLPDVEFVLGFSDEPSVRLDEVTLQDKPCPVLRWGCHTGGDMTWEVWEGVRLTIRWNNAPSVRWGFSTAQVRSSTPVAPGSGGCGVKAVSHQCRWRSERSGQTLSSAQVWTPYHGSGVGLPGAERMEAAPDLSCWQGAAEKASYESCHMNGMAYEVAYNIIHMA